MNAQRLKKEDQTIDNVLDASLIKTIFTSANLNVSKVLDIELNKCHYGKFIMNTF